MTSPETDGGHAHAQSKDTHETTTAGPGASVNRISIRFDANSISVIALILAVAALCISISQAVMTPQNVDAKIAANAADTRAQFGRNLAEVRVQIADSVATAQATAQAGKEHARIALDEVQRSNALLETKGLISPRHH